MNADLSEFLSLLKSHEVEFMVIGARALAFHGRPRMTEDIDLWVRRNDENAKRLGAAMFELGLSIGPAGITRFTNEDRQMIRFGAPPAMIDLLNFCADLQFEPVFERPVYGDLEGHQVRFPSKEDFIAMKRSAGRPQDLADLDRL
jgi:predicted nucleotidyltransferase